MHQKECAALPKQPTPRKGTETPDQILVSGVDLETTHTPQGDGNPDRLNWWIPGRRNNPHPARGRKLRLCCSGAIVDRNNPHPARGRKQRLAGESSGYNGNNPHPARGRKPRDRNRTGIFCKKQPTPRKGTETCRVRSAAGSVRKQPTPRKGTETSSHPYTDDPKRNNPHPARGRKHCTIHSNFTGSWKQPTPRKGAETQSGPLIKTLLCETTHTPQGDGKPFVFTLQKLLEKPFTSPAGDN